MTAKSDKHFEIVYAVNEHPDGLAIDGDRRFIKACEAEKAGFLRRFANEPETRWMFQITNLGRELLGARNPSYR